VNNEDFMVFFYVGINFRIAESFYCNVIDVDGEYKKVIRMMNNRKGRAFDVSIIEMNKMILEQCHCNRNGCSMEFSNAIL
jgi:hypothetical protein